MSGPDLRLACEAIDSVVIADFDPAGQPLGGNAGLRRVSPGSPLSLWQLLTQPAPDTLIDAPADSQGRVYAGLLTVLGTADAMVTLHGTLYRTAAGLRLVAGYDLQAFESLSMSLLALNEEVNQAYRALALSKQALQAREAQILQLSLTDALTGVGNRRALDAALLREVERAVRQAQPLSLLILDLDHFKRVNDRWGHEAGDRVLAQTGALLRGGLRPSDVATRMGGEEFVLLLPATAADAARCCAERLRAALAAQDFGLGVPVTASLGLAWLGLGETGPALLARADGALYQAKQQGRNRVQAADPTQAALVLATGGPAPQGSAHE